MSETFPSDREIDYQLALRSAAHNYTKTLIMSAVIAVVGFVGLWVTVSLNAGAMFVVGLVLGVVNSQMVQRSLARAVTDGKADKKSIGFGVLKRLGLITGIAVVIAVVYQPDGWLVFVGLMVFQMLTLATVLMTLARQMRQVQT